MILIALLLLAAVTWKVNARTVFAHFMIGNTGEYAYADFQDDIKLAREAHIDGFALNFAYNDPVNDRGIEQMFNAAEEVGFKLIFSFDYAGNGLWPKEDVAYFLDQYVGRSAYFRHNGQQPLVSTFEGPKAAQDWVALKKQYNVFFMPSYSSLGAKKAMATGVCDGLFSWAAWPKGATFMDTEVDASYKDFLGGKPYMMPVSPWFFTNMPGYHKNWLWSSNDLWYTRWNHVWYELPEYVQIISWNDYGESHHIGPVRTKAMVAFDTGKSPFNYALDRDHDAWRMTLPFVIDMYKGAAPPINKELLTVWYRRNLARSCSTGGTTGNTASQMQVEGNPSDFLPDTIQFTALLASSADVYVTIGSNARSKALIDFEGAVPNGVGLYHGQSGVRDQTGQVRVDVVRNGVTVMSYSGPTIDSSCTNGINNWNPVVGGVKSSSSVSAVPVPLSQLACVSGTGNKNDDDPQALQKLCQVACAYHYCPSGPCTCQLMGTPRDAPAPKAKEGFTNPTSQCMFLGLCSFGCGQGVCPTSRCNQDPSNKGKCYVPPDVPDPTPTPTTTTPLLPSSTNDWHYDSFAAEAENASGCLLFRPPDRVTTLQFCDRYCKPKIEEGKKQGITVSVACIAWQPDTTVPFNWTSIENVPAPTMVLDGKCACNNPALAIVAETLVDSLAAIGQIGCYILMSTLKLLVTVGLDVLPGGAAANAGLRGLSQAAKTIGYAYDASQAPQDAFDFWLAPCGGTNLVPDELKKTFDILQGIADLDWKTPKFPKGSGQKGDSNNPDRDRSGNSNNGGTVTITKVTRSTAVLSTITKTCKAKDYTNACYHYYSVHQNYNWISKQFTCTDNYIARTGRVAPTAWTQAHKDRTWWTFKDLQYEFKSKIKSVECDADEYPPIYFIPAGSVQNIPSRNGQIIRWLPLSENRGVAALWGGFCGKSDGGEGNTQFKIDKSLNTAVVKVNKKDVETDKKNNRVTEKYDIDYTRAVFEMAFDWSGATKPSAANSWGLKENPCWPEAIISEDPGFVLLYDDDWYNKNPGLQKYRSMYNAAPDATRLAAAKKKVGLKKRDNDPVLLALEDGGIAVRNANSSRRLTAEDVESDVEVIDCKDRFCTRELAELKRNGQSEDLALRPGDPLPVVPPLNVVPIEMMTEAPTLAPSPAIAVASLPLVTLATVVRG